MENQPHDEEVTLASDGDDSSMGSPGGVRITCRSPLCFPFLFPSSIKSHQLTTRAKKVSPKRRRSTPWGKYHQARHSLSPRSRGKRKRGARGGGWEGKRRNEGILNSNAFGPSVVRPAFRVIPTLSLYPRTVAPLSTLAVAPFIHHECFFFFFLDTSTSTSTYSY